MAAAVEAGGEEEAEEVAADYTQEAEEGPQDRNRVGNHTTTSPPDYRNEKIKNKYKDDIYHSYGYCADPDLPGWKNKEAYILQLSPEQYLSRPSNMACHNYCKYSAMPTGTRSLLGLVLKYCLRKARPNNAYDKTIARFRTNIRSIAHFHFHPPEEEEDKIRYIPGLYHKGDWDPPSSIKEVEDSINNF